MGLAAIPSPCLPLSDSETLGSLIFLIYLLSVYPSAPLQMYKLHEGEGFSLLFFSCILYTLNSAWYMVDSQQILVERILKGSIMRGSGK